jgi:hypothetical protein
MLPFLFTRMSDPARLLLPPKLAISPESRKWRRDYLVSHFEIRNASRHRDRV